MGTAIEVGVVKRIIAYCFRPPIAEIAEFPAEKRPAQRRHIRSARDRLVVHDVDVRREDNALSAGNELLAQICVIESYGECGGIKSADRVKVGFPYHQTGRGHSTRLVGHTQGIRVSRTSDDVVGECMRSCRLWPEYNAAMLYDLARSSHQDTDGSDVRLDQSAIHLSQCSWYSELDIVVQQAEDIGVNRRDRIIIEAGIIECAWVI